MSEVPLLSPSAAFHLPNTPVSKVNLPHAINVVASRGAILDSRNSEATKPWQSPVWASFLDRGGTIHYRGTLLIRNRPPLRLPSGPRHSPAVGSLGGAVSYERDTSVPPSARELSPTEPSWLPHTNLIAASTHDKYSLGPSIRPICTGCCFTMTYMIQVCSTFH